MVLDPIPQSLPVIFFGSLPQPPTSRWKFLNICNTLTNHTLTNYTLIYSTQDKRNSVESFQIFVTHSHLQTHKLYSTLHKYNTVQHFQLLVTHSRTTYSRTTHELYSTLQKRNTVQKIQLLVTHSRTTYSRTTHTRDVQHTAQTQHTSTLSSTCNILTNQSLTNYTPASCTAHGTNAVLLNAFKYL